MRTIGEIIREKIITKYRSVTRFAALSGVPHKRIYDALRGTRPELIQEVEAKIESTPDGPLDHEVSEELLARIHAKLGQMTTRELRNWCQDHGVYHYWLSRSVLTGDVRFKSRKLKKLMEILDLK